MKSLVGCFFGSFNPVHQGHLQVVDNCIQQLNLHEVLVIVSPLNPLKLSPLVDFHHRLAMTKLAFASRPKVTVSDIEHGLPQPNYTIHTLKKLMELFPSKRWALLIGQDNSVDFHQWKDHKQILNLVDVYAHSRKLSSEQKPSEYIRNIQILSFDWIPISSTQIRDLIAQNQAFEHLVPHQVAQYIKTNQLYR